MQQWTFFFLIYPSEYVYELSRVHTTNGIAGHGVCALSTMLTTVKLLGKLLMPVYTSSSIWVFLFPHILRTLDIIDLFNFDNLISEKLSLL